MRILEKIARDTTVFCDYYRNNGNIKSILLDDQSRNLSVDSGRQSLAITKRLIPVYHGQKEFQDKIPSPYRLGGAWQEEINTRRQEYLKALNENDAEGLNSLLSNLFRNSGIAGLWSIAYLDKIANGSIFVKIKFVREILRNFINWRNLVDADIKELEIPLTGNPWGYLLGATLVLPNSFSHHYCANRMKHLFADSKRPIICEIGGGYGGFAYYLSKTLHSSVYINFDLPEVLLICSYYLAMNLPYKKVLLFDKQMFGKPLPDLNNFDIVLMPNYMLPFLADKSVDAVINTHSLSEMDYQTIEEYLRQIDRITRRYFFHINSDETALNTGGHKEIKSSTFPIDKKRWKNVYTALDPFSESARNKEYLYELRSDA